MARNTQNKTITVEERAGWLEIAAVEVESTHPAFAALLRNEQVGQTADEFITGRFSTLVESFNAIREDRKANHHDELLETLTGLMEAIDANAHNESVRLVIGNNGHANNARALLSKIEKGGE